MLHVTCSIPALLFFIIALSAGGMVQASMILNLSPEADALVNANLSSTNYGAYFLLHVGRNSVYNRNSYLKFDLADLSGINDADILSATLYLYLAAPANYKVPIFVKHVDNDSWLENTINSSPNQPAQGATIYTSPGNHSAGWVAFNLLANGNGWVSGDLTDEKLSLGLTTNTSTTGTYGSSLGTAQDYKFYSREHTDASYRPYLRVEYIPIVTPEPSTMLLMGSGLLVVAGLILRRKESSIQRP
jgi:hypothetical protein